VSETAFVGDQPEPAFGPVRTIIRSIYELDPPMLEELAQWLEQRGIRTPVSSLVGGDPALMHITQGVGAPNGAVTASVGALYLRLDGGAATTLYVKESGANTNSGWVAK